VWFTPFAYKRVRVQVKLWDPLQRVPYFTASVMRLSHKKGAILSVLNLYLYPLTWVPIFPHAFDAAFAKLLSPVFQIRRRFKCVIQGFCPTNRQQQKTEQTVFQCRTPASGPGPHEGVPNQCSTSARKVTTRLYRACTWLIIYLCYLCHQYKSIKVEPWFIHHEPCFNYEYDYHGSTFVCVWPTWFNYGLTMIVP